MIAEIWWNKLTDNQQNQLIVKYEIMRGNGYCDYEYIEDDEIEEIWRKEMNKEDDKITEEMEWDHNTIEQNFIKPNQKQFKEFNSELFKAYIDKFSDEDKIKAAEILLDYFPKGYFNRA